MTTRTKLSKEDFLKRLKANTAQSKTSSATYLPKFKEGETRLRILPSVGDMEPAMFWSIVGKHYNLPGGNAEICRDITTMGEYPCPICEIQRELYRGSDEEKDLAGQIYASRKIYFNVVARPNGDPKSYEGPYVMEAGKTIADGLFALFENSEYGYIADPTYERVTDGDQQFEEGGIDVIVNRTGTGRLDTKYEVNPARYGSPLAPSEEAINEILEKARDLTPYVMTGDPDVDREKSADTLIVVETYEHLLQKYSMIGDSVEEPEPEPEVEETVVEDTAKNEIQERLRARRRRS